jgi:hypothetical protein
MLDEQAAKEVESAINSIEKFAAGRVKRGITDLQRSQATGLLNAVESLRETKGSVKQMTEAMRMVGEAAFSSSDNALASIPADKIRLRALYGKMSDAIKGTVARNVEDGEQIVFNLETSNKAMHKWFGEKSILAPILGNKSIADENILRRILSDTKKVEAFKGLFGADSEIVAAVKASALEDLVKVDLSDAQDIYFTKFSKALDNKKFVLEKLMDKGELDEVQELVELANRFGPEVVSAPSAGLSGGMRDLPRSTAEAAINATVIKAMKERAAGLTPPPTASGAGAGTMFAPPVSQAKPSIGFRRPDAYKKILQVTGAQETSRQKKEKENK